MSIKKIALSFTLFLCFSSLFAAKNEPGWVNEPSSVYPKDKYFCAVGYASEAESAKANALGNLAQNLQSSVLVVTNAEINEQQINGVTDKSSLYNRTIQTVSSISLSGVEYSEVYFDKKKKLYYCAAYIENEFLFEQISVKIERPLKLMNSFLEKAENLEKNGNPFGAYLLLSDAEENSENFLSYYYILYIADKKSAFSAYKNEVTKAYEISLVKADYLKECVLNIKTNEIVSR